MCGCNGEVKLFLNPWGLSQLSIQLILPVQTSSSVPGKAEQQADHDQKGCRFVFSGTAEVPYPTLYPTLRSLLLLVTLLGLPSVNIRQDLVFLPFASFLQ